MEVERAISQVEHYCMHLQNSTIAYRMRQKFIFKHITGDRNLEFWFSSGFLTLYP